ARAGAVNVTLARSACPDYWALSGTRLCWWCSVRATLFFVDNGFAGFPVLGNVFLVLWPATISAHEEAGMTVWGEHLSACTPRHCSSSYPGGTGGRAGIQGEPWAARCGGCAQSSAQPVKMSSLIVRTGIRLWQGTANGPTFSIARTRRTRSAARSSPA